MRRIVPVGIFAAVTLWLLYATALPLRALGASPLDDFLCYATHSKLGISATLTDGLDSGAVTSKGGARVFCTPADPNSIADPVTHLKGWRIAGPNATKTNITVQNEFGTFKFDTRPARTLLVPAHKSLPPAPPPQFDPNNDPNSEVDHYHCAFVRVTRGTPKFPKGITRQIVDQFGTRTIAVKQAFKLCVPTNKNGEGIKHVDRDLMCYRAKATPRTQVDAAQESDQFGTETLKLRREAELCVPSTSSLGSPSGAFLDASPPLL